MPSSNRLAYDNHLIQEKRIPFLDSDLPLALAASTVCAEDICFAWPLPDSARLPVTATTEAVHAARQKLEAEETRVRSELLGGSGLV